MRPDERLEQQLAAAGDRGRSASTPDAAYAETLKDRLLAQYPAPEVVTPDAPAPPRRWFSLPRPMRAAPLALAAVLAVATVVGARELYVAFVAPPAASSSPTPIPSVQATPSVTPRPTLEPTEVPTAEPAPSVTPAPMPVPTAVPTPVPTPKPTPAPTAKPTAPPVATLELDALGCNGGVVLEWSAYTGAGFDHYVLLRSTSADGSGKPLDGTWSSHVEKTTGHDATGQSGATYWYRAAAYDASGGLIARSGARAAVAKQINPLGALAVGPVEGGTKVKWNPYGGLSACFTYYKVVYSLENPKPSYLAGDTAVAVGGQSSRGVVLTELKPGKTYFIRVQVIRSTHLGSFLVAQSDVSKFTVP